MPRRNFRWILSVLLVLVCARPALPQRTKVSNLRAPAQAQNSQAQTNLALNKGVTASSSDEQASWGARFIVDGQRDEKAGSRGWSSIADKSRNHTEWVQIDLGASSSLGRVDLYPRNDPARLGEGFPVDFTIGVSADGKAWTAVVRQTNYPKPGNSVQSFSFDPANARYVRVTGTNLRYLPAESAYYMQFAEVEVYAPAQASEPAGKAALAGSSWQGEIRLSDGRTRTFTAAVDGGNRISGQVALSTNRSAANVALQGTYDPATGAISLRYGGTGAPGGEQGTLTATAASATDVSGQATVTSASMGQRRSAQGTWSMGRR